MDTTTQTPPPQGLDPLVVNLAKSIRQSESGGDFSAQGKSNEYGAYQFTDGTWNTAAQKYLGQAVPLRQATKEQQNEVAYKQIKEWKDSGFNIGQVASMWNAGQDEPNAYLGTFSDGKPSKGVNKFGVHYDVPAYAESVASTYQKLKNGLKNVGADPNNPSSTASTENQNIEAPSIGSSIVGGAESLVKSITQAPRDFVDALGSLFGAGGRYLSGDTQGGSDILNQEASKIGAHPILKGIGDALQSAALVAPAEGIPEAIAGGAAMGAGSSLSSAEPTVSSTLGGATIGGTLGLAGGLVSKAFEILPKSLTESAFKGLAPDEIEKVLAEKSAGTSNGILKQSQKSLSNYGKQIDTILKNTTSEGAGDFSVRALQTQYPEQKLTSLLAKIKKLIPSGNKAFDSTQWDRAEILGLIDKIQNGTATLWEKNRVRSAIDSVTSNSFTKMAKAINPSAGHDIAMTFADALRAEVQNSEPTTKPIFEQFAKEMNIQKVVKKIAGKTNGGIIRWRDLIPFLGGSALGGPLAGVGGVLAERAAENPAIQFGAAKAIQGAGKVVRPVASRAGLLAPLLNRASNGK